MLKKVLLAVVALIVVLLVVIAMRPSTYRVERSASMSAAPAAVYAQVADFRKWNAWSPWAKIDPNCKNTFGGAASGKGATFEWDGNDDVGAGKMTITDAKEPSSLSIELRFMRPWEDVADTGFRFDPEGAGTKVTWFMDGKLDFMGKAMDLFMGFDKMIGADYDKGLAAIKAIVETPAGK